MATTLMTCARSILSLALLAALLNMTPVRGGGGGGGSCEKPVQWSGTRNVTIAVGAVNRTFELFVPFQGHGECGIDQWCTGPPNSSAPLVINWHGCNGHMPLVDYHTTISKVADYAKDHGYYSIHPVGTSETPDLYGSEWGWNADGIPCGKVGVDDFAFFEALLAFAEEQLCVDMTRVYTVGFSTGAFLSYGIACRFPQRIAAAGCKAVELEAWGTRGGSCAVASCAAPIVHGT